MKKPTIFKVTTRVMVSNYDENFIWLGTEESQVFAGTSLPAKCTTSLYHPSKEGMTGKYDPETDTWTEIVDRRTTPFYDMRGRPFVENFAEAEIPVWGIEEKPPVHDGSKFDPLYDRDAKEWKLLENRIGQHYFDKFANKLTVSSSHFELPEDCSFEGPTEEVEVGYAHMLVGGQWETIRDLRNQMAYAKNQETDQDFVIEKLGFVVPDTHTLDEPKPFHVWVEGEGWVYSEEMHRPYKAQEEADWTNGMISKVINRLDQYERDQKYPEDMRVSLLNADEYNSLIALRKQLCDRSKEDDFPFNARPEIPDYV